MLKDYGYGTPVAKQTFTPGTRTGKLYQSLIGMEHAELYIPAEMFDVHLYQSLIGMEHNKSKIQNIIIIIMYQSLIGMEHQTLRTLWNSCRKSINPL